MKTLLCCHRQETLIKYFHSFFLVNMSLQSDTALCTHNIQPVKWPLLKCANICNDQKNTNTKNRCEKISERVVTLIFNISHLRIKSSLLFLFFSEFSLMLEWTIYLFTRHKGFIYVVLYKLYCTQFSWNASLTSINYNLPVLLLASNFEHKILNHFEKKLI